MCMCVRTFVRESEIFQFIYWVFYDSLYCILKSRFFDDCVSFAGLFSKDLSSGCLRFSLFSYFFFCGWGEKISLTVYNGVKSYTWSKIFNMVPVENYLFSLYFSIIFTYDLLKPLYHPFMKYHISLNYAYYIFERHFQLHFRRFSSLKTGSTCLAMTSWSYS